LTVTVEPASAVPVITMPSRSLSRVDRVVAAFHTRDRTVVPAVNVRGARICGRVARRVRVEVTVTRHRRPEPEPE
jgi:hypothetical protein